MRLLARFITAVFALTLAAMTVATPAGAGTGFGDVEPGRWYSEPVTWMVAEGITNGTSPGCFSPDDRVTRGQIVTFLFRLDEAEGNQPTPAEHPFTDIVSAYQDDPVGWAFAERITTGTGATTFSPDASITRGDFAVLLWRYAGQPTATRPHPFTDVGRAYQQAAIGWMAETGITTGTSATTFSPDGGMTRAEAATFFHRFVGRPTVVAPAAPAAVCLQEYADVLVDAGLTPAEATCAAPFVADLGLDTLVGVLGGTQPFSGDVVTTLSEILTAGCISPDRQADLIRIFL